MIQIQINFNIKKATSAIFTQAGTLPGNTITAQAIFGNMVLSTGWSIIGTTAFTATGLVAGDRGCLPILGTGAAQGTAAQMTLATQSGAAAIAGATGVASDAVFADYGLIVTVLCSTHGVCCTTFNCNSSYILIKNIYLISLLLSIAVAKLIF